MDNMFTNQYVPNGFENTNQQGINPVFQNAAMQQAYMNQMLSQGNSLASPQGFHQTNGLSPLALATALRKSTPIDQNAQNMQSAQMNNMSAYNPYNQYQTVQNYGTDPYSQQSLMLASQDSGM